MRKAPIRVGLIVGKMVGGGVESILLDLLKYSDNKKYVFDFIIDNDSTVVPEDKMKELGAKIEYVPPYQHIFSYMAALIRLFKKKKYLIVHANISSLNLFPLFAAKLCHVPVRISHNHNLIAPGAGFLRNSLKKFLSKFGQIFPNYMVAPTNETGKWVFNEGNFKIIKNGIDLKKFQFDDEIRKKIRKELGVKENEFLLGSFGRFVTLKRLDITLIILSELKKKGLNCKLILIGDGPRKSDLKKKVQEDSVLQKNVIFLNSQKKIEEYYSAIDAYLFPSSAEAFGIAAVESQASGVSTFVSDGVPDEAKLSNELFVKIKSIDPQEWVQEISKKILSENDFLERKLTSKRIVNSGKLSSQQMANDIQNLYDEAVNNEKG